MSLTYEANVPSRHNNGLRVLTPSESSYLFPTSSTCYVSVNKKGARAGKGKDSRVNSTMCCAEKSTEGCLSSFKSLLTEDGYIHECKRCFDKVCLR